MSRIKKLIFICMALSMVASVSLLSGCKAKINTPATGGQTAQEDSRWPKDDPNADVTLTYVLYGDNLADSQKVWEEVNQKLSQKLPHTKVNFVAIDGPSYDDKTRLMVAAGQDFDIMWSSDWKGDSVGKLAGGAFMEIGDLMNKYAPELYKFIPETSWAAGQNNGKLYGVVSHQTIVNGNSIGIPRKYYTKYGNIIDSAEISKMAKDFNTSGVDILKKLEPMLAKINAEVKELPTVGNFTAMFAHNYEALYNTGSAGAMLDVIGLKKGDKTLKVYSELESKEFKDYIQLMADWNKKGYMTKDLATFLKTPNNKISSVVGIGNYAIPGPTADQVNIAFIGEASDQFEYAMPYNGAKAGKSGNYINAKSKNPIRAIKFMDTLVRNVDIYNTFCFGDKGVHFTAEADGTIKTIPKDYKMRDWLIGNTDYSLAKAGTNNQTQLKENSAAMTAAPKAPISGVAFDIANVKNEIASINSVVTEYGAAFAYGMYGDNTSTKYTEFINKLKQAGLDKVVAEAQKQIDDLAKAKGITK